MNYETALALKNAGFPQGTGTYYLDDKRHAHGSPEFVEHFVAEYEAKDTRHYHFAYVPTLEELIETCGVISHAWCSIQTKKNGGLSVLASTKLTIGALAPAKPLFVSGSQCIR